MKTTNELAHSLVAPFGVRRKRDDNGNEGGGMQTIKQGAKFIILHADIFFPWWPKREKKEIQQVECFLHGGGGLYINHTKTRLDGPGLGIFRGRQHNRHAGSLQPCICALRSVSPISKGIGRKCGIKHEALQYRRRRQAKRGELHVYTSSQQWRLSLVVVVESVHFILSTRASSFLKGRTKSVRLTVYLPLLLVVLDVERKMSRRGAPTTAHLIGEIAYKSPLGWEKKYFFSLSLSLSPALPEMDMLLTHVIHTHAVGGGMRPFM